MRRFETNRKLILGLVTVVAMVVAGCNTGAETPALTQEEVEGIVAESIAEIPTPATGISRFDAETLLVNEITEFLASRPSLNRVEVEEIVASELAEVEPSAPEVSRDLVEEIVGTAISEAVTSALSTVTATLAELEELATRAEVEASIADAIASIPTPEPDLTLEDVAGVVSTAIAGIPAPERGLDDGDVERIVGTAIAAIPSPETGATASEVRAIVSDAIDALPDVQPGLTVEEAERIARRLVADIPTESAPAKFTKFFVNNAIARYEDEGLEATLEYYNNKDSVDGRWYVFIVDDSETLIAHHDPRVLGSDIKGDYGHDANGRAFWQSILEADEDGKWVSYVDDLPGAPVSDRTQKGAVEYKHVWVVKHDGLLFGSGWYVAADEYTQSIVDDAIRRFEEEGLLPTLTHYNSPRSIEAEWYVFIAGPDRSIIGHYQRQLIGSPLSRLLGTQVDVDGEGVWHIYGDVNPVSGEFEPKIFWLVEHGGYVFGSGWHRLGNPIPEY